MAKEVLCACGLAAVNRKTPIATTMRSHEICDLVRPALRILA